jgi:DNA-binding IclR family transcriptional regulator
MSADGEESIGMPIIGPHPELQATISVSVAVEINLEKQQSCMIRLPRCPASHISAKTEDTSVIRKEEEMAVQYEDS